MGDMAKNSIIPILVVVVVVLFQFESQYLKNHKSYRSAICIQVCSDYPKCTNLS